MRLDAHSREFLDEFKKKYEKYDSWIFDYIYPGYHSYYSDSTDDLVIFFTPDNYEKGCLDIQMQTKEGEYIEKFETIYNIPSEIEYQEPLTPEKLFNCIKPLLDQLKKH